MLIAVSLIKLLQPFDRIVDERSSFLLWDIRRALDYAFSFSITFLSQE